MAAAIKLRGSRGFAATDGSAWAVNWSSLTCTAAEDAGGAVVGAATLVVEEAPAPVVVDEAVCEEEQALAVAAPSTSAAIRMSWGRRWDRVMSGPPRRWSVPSCRRYESRRPGSSPLSTIRSDRLRPADREVLTGLC